MCSKLNPVCDVGKTLGWAGSKAADSVFAAVAQSFGSAAASVTKWMWTVISDTTTVDLSGGWFHSMLGITSTLAGVVVLAIFVLELIKAVLRREPGALGRATVGVGGGLLGAAASIGVLEALLAATDALSDGIVRTAGLGNIAKLGAEVAPAGAIASVNEPALVLILGLGYLVASFFVWALFVGRKAMIIIAAVFAPVAFSGAASRATAGWVRKWVEFTLAMVFSKLVVVIILTLALSLVGSPGHGMAAVGALFSGLAMMVIACFAPWMLLRLVHFIGGDVAAAHHQGVNQAVMTAGSNSLNMARTGAAKVSGLLGSPSSGTGGQGAASAAAVTPPSPSAKPLTNNPVIKDGRGPGPAQGGDTPGPSGSRPSGPSGLNPPPGSGPTDKGRGWPDRPPQPASLPATP